MDVSGISCGKDEILELSTEHIKNCHGFSMDMGGSLLKIIYRSKADYQEVNETKKTSKLHMVTFVRATQMQDALKYLKEHCFIPRANDQERPEMFATGVGCHLYSKEINDALGVKIQIKPEFEYFVKAFSAMTHRIEEFLYPVCVEEIEQARREFKSSISLEHQAMLASTVSSSAEGTKSESNTAADNASRSAGNKKGRVQFPCILAMLGSASGYMLIQEDGTYRLINGSFRGGRMMIGLGRMLTGAKNFDDLLSLAAKGDNSTVDTFKSNLTKSDNPDSDASFYGVLNSKGFAEGPIYCFGRGIEGDLDHFKKEDVARALVNTTCLDIVDMIIDSVRISNTPRVYVCGGIASSSLIRKTITLEVGRKMGFMAFFHEQIEPIDLQFIRKGEVLGALGAFLLNQQKPEVK